MLAAADLVDDPVTRWSALVLGVGGIILGVLYAIAKLRTLARDLGIVKHEVKNDHKTNLRVEADDRHEENRTYLESIDKKVDRILKIIGQHDYRLDELEHTIDRPPKGPTS